MVWWRALEVWQGLGVYVLILVGMRPSAVCSMSVGERAHMAPTCSCGTSAQRCLHWCAPAHPWGSVFWFPFFEASVREPVPGCTHERTEFS